MRINKRKILTGAVALVIGTGLFGYGYMLGKGYFYELDYEGSMDSTLDLTGSASDAFMTEYTTMTWAGRDTYGNFFVVYKPTNEGEPENTITYTIFYEEDEGEKVIRLKVIDEKGNELLYRISDYFKDGETVKIADANETGILVDITKKGSQYNLFLPMTKDREPVVVHGVYKLAEGKAKKTESHRTTGQDANEVMKEIDRNFKFVE